MTTAGAYVFSKNAKGGYTLVCKTTAEVVGHYPTARAAMEAGIALTACGVLSRAEVSSTVGLYYVRWDGGQIIDQYNGGPVPLVTALQEFYGVQGVSIHRADGTLVVDNAGSSVSVTHAPTGRHYVRGSGRRFR